MTSPQRGQKQNPSRVFEQARKEIVRLKDAAKVYTTIPAFSSPFTTKQSSVILLKHDKFLIDITSLSISPYILAITWGQPITE